MTKGEYVLMSSLRKGTTTIEYWHEYGADEVNATNTEIELKERHAVFRTILKPVDGNQRMDADRLFIENLDKLSKITFNDAQIRKKLSSFLNAYTDQIDYIILEVDYGKKLLFDVDLKPFGEDGLSFTIKS